MAPCTDESLPKGWAAGIAESRDLTSWTKVGELLPAEEYERNGLCAAGAVVLAWRNGRPCLAP
jgi:sucrose-6-phosphate hydrolase SacC (GH32 family)